MRNESLEITEKLIRVRTTRRGIPVELLVHYEIARTGGCDTYLLFSLDEAD